MKALDDEKKEAMAPPKLNNYSYDERNDKMLSDALGTELIIEKCIRALRNEEGHGAQTWPADAVLNKNLVKSLSHSKMKNEVDHQAPRTLDEAGVLVPIPLCESVGFHGGFKQMRQSKIAKQLGIGFALYFKMLKYMGCLFLLFTLMSIFPMMIYFSGGEYEQEKIHS